MKKILLLATDQALSGVLKEKLSYFKFRVKVLDNPDHAFYAIRDYNPDVVVIDFFLQDNNGGAVCHQIKCDPDTHHIPVIILSEYPEFLISSKKFGCNQLVIKPIDLSDLLFKINECIGKTSGQGLFSSEKSRQMKHKSRLFHH